MPIKALLLEDEKTSNDLMSLMIAKDHNEIEIVATSTSLQEAKAKIEVHHPDVVFINFQLSRREYFQMKNKLAYQRVSHSELMIDAVTKALQIIE